MTTGRLLLHDLAAMNAAQQSELAGWITTAGAGVQIVSIASQSLWPLVANGRFLDGLYYRLNTIVCAAVPGDARSSYDEGAAAP
jgi:DNA-binding NtrC family response regulator